MKKHNKKEEYKVKCTITTSNHEKICYPFIGTLLECRAFINAVALDMFTNQRRSSNLQHFYGFSRFDDVGLIYFRIKRSQNYKDRIILDYGIEDNK